MSETMAVQEHLYDAETQLTELVDFGTDLKSVMSGSTPIPPGGLRFNWNFQGEIKGQKVKGKIVGTNYVLLRPDGVGIASIQAVLTTPEGDRIAAHADGMSILAAGTPVRQYRETVTFYSANPKYSWINHVICWATGTVDVATGKSSLKGFVA